MIKNKNIMQKLGWTVLVSVLIIILIAMAYMIATTDRVIAPAPDPSAQQQITTTGSTPVLSDALKELGLDIDPELIASLEASELATLDSVRDKEEYGIASRSYEKGVFELDIVVSSPPPAQGKFYEVWLVGSRVVSVGALEEDEIEEGAYALSYSSSEDLTDLNKVVVTEETTALGLDNMPETHTLEGSF